MRCPTCQQQIADDVLSCPSCGFSFDDVTRRLESGVAHDKKPAGKASTTEKSRARDSATFTSFDSIDEARFVPGMILVDRYRIVGLLGRGGMGEVYRADDLKLGQPVALKFLPEHLVSDGAALARFHREVRIARQVSHHNVCRVYDIGEVDGRHFLSMEFIKGEELSSLLRRIGRLPSDKATEISRQLCAGLAAAHNRGVLHRDLKPANVMIDENGNVRLTDFGIAGFLDDRGSDELRAGTPAYMSPEQLAGGELTVKSDLFSLGLVVYEIFTGKKAFDAPTLPQLLSLRNSDSTPTTPSSIVQNLDPLVERAILRCIEKDPERRPSSALEVAASLPGGDPLAAALAAGETPSPEMVAAAPREGFLKPKIAIPLLAAIVIAAVVVLLLSEKTQLHRRVPLEKSPEALQERARTIVNKLGYVEPYVDSTYGLGSDFEYLRYAETKNPSWLSQLPTSQPASLYFWYRQSPAFLVPRFRLSMRPSPGDPPETVPGMVTVYLDPKGRLIEFHAVPPEIDNSTTTPAAPNWSALFEEAGLNQAAFVSTPSKWLPPFESDSRSAWEGKLSDQLQIPIRIEAAAYAGKPIFFKIIGPWNSGGTMRRPTSGPFVGKIIVFALVTATLAFVSIGVWLGRRNLRDGSGDRKGGARLAMYIFLALMIAWVFRTRHYSGDEELNLLELGIQFALLPTLLLWLFYLALEPYVRRWWPHRMVSWSRLLAGDFRDPLIGRDVLIGSLFGMASVIVSNLWYLSPGWLGHPQAPTAVRLHTLLGLRESIGEFFFTGVTLIVFIAVMCMLFLLLVHVIFRKKDWLGFTVAWLFFTIVGGLGDRISIINLLFSAVYAALIVVAATRFGLLTLTSMLFFVMFFGRFPLSTDFSTWYAPSTIFALIVATAVVTFAFYTSLGGQAVFKGSSALKTQ
jgi:serine/threonine protein kinase